ncbi:low specificity L-threonine aldolase [Natronomonas sp. F2-12]|jgi:threonine aldolase|uniref:Low specificity L-threonine aldolase n=1 Tax=Natronomonas aquatica TaxID=2841590 RepID=A0A9R1CSH3_9EURY|nr:low specificity L-threonine aldolase [Natronomonas aquatica]MCQ4333030.1 low specificity L-threonine aldolase [Natronomonas aquatica]
MIDLRSDTVTKPSPAMRTAAAEAEVGDDVYGEDPTVNELESRVAGLLGKEAALFVPSGTMGNQIAARVHTDREQEVLVERESHIYKWELGGLAQHSGLQVRTIDGGDRGVVTPEAIESGYVEADDHRPGTGLVCLENTHNSKGGTAIAADRIDAACAAAADRDVPVHLDGARLFNAATALGTDPARLVRNVDSVMCCLSKGLGAPVGSMVVGSEAFIADARRIRKLLGGGMRQAGVIAAPGLRALENRDRLSEDHENAERLAEGLAEIDGLAVEPPETNIVLLEPGEPVETFLGDCKTAGVLGVPFEGGQVRFCTHLAVDADDIGTAIDRIAGR